MKVANKIRATERSRTQRGETPLEPAGEDARATAIRRDRGRGWEASEPAGKMAALLRRRGARLVQRLGGFLRQGKVDSSRVVRVSDDWPEFFDAKIRDAWLARKGFVFCVQK